jgi:hypothetical protein
MRRHVAVALCAAGLSGLVAVAGVASTTDPGGQPAAAAFRLADGSAGCNFRSSGEIACRAEGEAAAAVLEPDGGSRASTDEIVSWDDATPVLLASESWWNGDVSCSVAAGTIHCSAGDGAIAAGAGGVGGIR